VKHRRHKSEAAPEPELPVTPMLDMAFQLLTFFIFTYHPSGMEGQMELLLPSKMVSKANYPKNVDPMAVSDKEPEPEIPLDITVVVQAGPNGYTLTLQEGVVSTPMTSKEALQKHLEKVFAGKDTEIKAKAANQPDNLREGFLAEEYKKLGVKLQGSSSLRWEQIIEVADACRSAKFLNISYAQPPDLNLGS